MSQPLRENVSDFIDKCQFDELAELVVQKRSTLRYLYRLLYTTEEITRQRTIEAMGIVAKRMAREDTESVRVIIRTLLWTINDESGGIGWSAPEAIAEIVYHLPDTFGEFASVVLASSDEPVLLPGVVRAAYRMAQSSPQLVQQFIPEYTAYLDNPDPVIRGYALKFIYQAGGKVDQSKYQYLLQDTGIVPLYVHGELKETTVADLAQHFFASV